jgi:cobalamin biosynthesis protein CobD/CbiB
VTAEAARIEALLREALAPVEPPPDIAQRLEGTLVSLTSMAQEELEAWELSAMRDPRNWARPAAAAVVGATAGAALVALRVRGRHHSRRAASTGLLDFAERTMKDIAEETRRVLGDS